MGTILIRIKPFTLLLSASILLQSCTIYKKSAVSLQEVAGQNVRTKVETTSGEVHRFKYITTQNDGFYGVKQIGSKLVNIRLNPQEIASVHPKNKSASTLATFGPLGLVTFFITLAIAGWS